MNTSYILLIVVLFLSACTKDKQPEAYPVEEDIFLKDVAYGDHEQQRMDVYLPTGRSSSTTKIVVFIHGGGWIAGDKGDFPITDENLPVLKTYFPGFALVNLNYRLTTGEENRYPAAEHDVKQAMDYLYRQLATYQLSSETYMAGGSAGAHLAALHTLKYNDDGRIKGCIAVSGVYDMPLLYEDGSAEAKLVVVTFMGGMPTNEVSRYKQASPIKLVTPSTPKFLLLHGTEDELVPVAQAYEFRDVLADSGVEHTVFTYSGGHGIPPEHLVEAFDYISTFLQ